VSRTFATAAAFKQALDQRLRNMGRAGNLARQRQVVVFHRFLARLSREFGTAMTLKGGAVLELRSSRSRATKDIDMNILVAPAAVLPRLQAAARLDLRDFMTFDVASDARHPEIAIPGMATAGQRYRVTCLIANKLYGEVFGVDVVFDAPSPLALDDIIADDLLGFAGISPPVVRAYPVPLHIAEKVHAYTQPRLRPNSRVKDLPDLAILAGLGALGSAELRAACEWTFAARGTHALPIALPAPPTAWDLPYAAMALADDLPWVTLTDVTAAVRAFLDPMLAGAGAAAVWHPDRWRWVVPDQE
jgi:hypothetical protein